MPKYACIRLHGNPKAVLVDAASHCPGEFLSRSEVRELYDSLGEVLLKWHKDNCECLTCVPGPVPTFTKEEYMANPSMVMDMAHKKGLVKITNKDGKVLKEISIPVTDLVL